MGRVSALVVFLLFLSESFAHAYTMTQTEGGDVVRWKNFVDLPLAGNPINRSGLTESQVYQAVVRGLQRWKAVSAGAVNFDYWQGTDPKVFEPNSDYNGLSSLYFTSNSTSGLSANVLGLTQVWYN